jgi:hypothetical protein
MLGQGGEHSKTAHRGAVDEAAFEDMEWATLRYSKKAVNRAGVYLAAPGPVEFDTDVFNKMLDVISNWRACHNFPLNTFQSGLRRRARVIDPACLVAQRIKRLSSIALKLERFPSMTLSQMQDIGGCRAVMSSSAKVRELVKAYRRSDIKHELSQMDDYIRDPKESGYRGVHLVYKYHSDKKADYNGLKIEMQLRSQMQHIWATAVETVGTFTEQALKSSQGEEDWLRFFALMGTVFAIAERTPPVPQTPTGPELLMELAALAEKLDVQGQLNTFGGALQVIESRDQKDDHFYLLELDPRNKQLNVTAFRASESDAAENAYLEAEKRMRLSPGAQAVLVSVDRITSLRRAYPNYFLDTGNFVSLLNDALTGRKLKVPRPKLIGDPDKPPPVLKGMGVFG